MHASAVIAFDSEEAAQKALKKRLLIAGISIKTAIFEAKSSDQCLKCQKFSSFTHTNATELIPIVNPVPFAQWGIPFRSSASAGH